MRIQLGANNHPLLEQFSEEGFVDLTFEIIDLIEDDQFYRFHVAASFEGEVVGFGVEVLKGIQAGFDSEMNLKNECVYKEGVKFFRTGEQSDRFLSGVHQLYGQAGHVTTMTKEETFTAIALHQGCVQLDSEPVKIKIFGRDGEPFSEEDYYESFFNVDLANRLIFWNEKDPDYRDSLLRGLSAE